MLSRSFCRAANPLKQGARGYASQSGSSGGGSGLLYAGLGAAALGGGYYYYSSSSKPAEVAQQAASAVAGASSGKKAFTGGDQGFISLKLAEIENLSHNTKRVRFALPEDDQESGLPVASALLFKYKGPEMEKPVLRPYTPTSDEDAKGHIDFVIKKYPGGAMSEHIHDLTPGQRLDIKGPLPKYPYKANEHDEVVMIAGGTGITPMYQVMRKIFSNPADKTKVTLLYGNQTEDDILLKQELSHLENTYPQRFRAFYTLDKPPKEWTAGRGHINPELLKTAMPEPQASVKIFVCGPPGLYKAISGAKVSPQDQGELDGSLKQLGYQKEQVYKF